MAHEFKDRIRGIASDYADKLRVEEEAKRRQAEDEQEFLSRFRIANERFILPVLKGLEEHSNNVVRFSAWGGGNSAQLQVSAQMMHNRITFQADHRREMVTVTTNDRDPSSIELSQVNQEWVENEVENRVRELLPR